MKIGFTCSAFDLLNAGHILMLKKCKERCDYLIVGLQTDPTIDRPGKNKPVQSLIERTIQLTGCKYVDRIIVYETEQDLLDILDTVKIDIRFIGHDHQLEPMTEMKQKRIDICNQRGIEIKYLERGGRFSTSELRERIENAKTR